MINCQPLEVVGRGSETQLQVSEHLNYLFQWFNPCPLNNLLIFLRMQFPASCDEKYIIFAKNEYLQNYIICLAGHLQQTLLLISIII